MGRGNDNTQLSNIEHFLLRATKKLKDPYNSLEVVLPYRMHSFYKNTKSMELFLEEVKAKIVVEVGSWFGASSIHIASCLPENGILYCIDHWRGSEEHQMFLKACHLKLYQQFLSNVIHVGLTHKIQPIRCDSVEGASFLLKKGLQPDIVYIDGAHDEKSVYEDLTAYYPLVKHRGHLCGDDWGWGKTSLPVQTAIKRFAKENNLQIDVKKNEEGVLWFWILREK